MLRLNTVAAVETGNRPADFQNPVEAKTVAVAGTFNSWDTMRMPLKRANDGTWKASLSLPTGRYEYRFVVDGQWLSDPKAKESAANPHGSDNSVVIV